MSAATPALILALAPVLLAACDGSESPAGEPSVGESRGADAAREVEAAAAAPRAQRANPASKNCVDAAGVLQIEKRPDGGEYGVCVFADNRQCEEWALLRGECARGGVKVTGYVTAAARYCAITGGTYTIAANSGTVDERGSCGLPGGTVCDSDRYFAGACVR